jgi:TNF receptor-associated protein 1
MGWRQGARPLSTLLQTTTATPQQQESRFARSTPNRMQRHFLSTTSDDAEASASAAPDTNKESMVFQAETRQLLDIVTNSLYTDKEVFLRELVSNASDALEKLRHVQSTGVASLAADDLPLEIHIHADAENGTLTVTDTGIGLTRAEMIDNLGTIARSGSKAFLSALSGDAEEQGDSFNASKGIIGKFGVGFYSAFMVGEKVEVRSKSAYSANAKDTPQVWSSDGTGTFDIGDLDAVDEQERGASIVIHLKPEFMEYSDPDKIEEILKKYSNFVNFPITLNGNVVNTMEAVWAMDAKEVSDETYTSFYRYVANALDEPLDRLHFRADAPLDVRALFFIPSFHSEKYGMGRMEPGVSLYSRKVLIESKSPDILPDWMRFVKGVVDSEDLPLSVSREKAQDSALIAKLRKVLTRKFISHLTQMAKKRPDKYQGEFYKEFGFFLKEGICQDFEVQEPLAKLLYFETSKSMRGDMISLDEYVANCTPEQQDIYYLHAPSRDMALQSPYMELFEKTGRDVILVYSALDDFVMANLEKYEGRNLVSIEKADIDLPKKKEDEESDDSTSAGSATLTEQEAIDFCNWYRVTLNDKVSKCQTTTRLGSSPAVVTDNESGAMRRMMRMVDTTDGGSAGIPLPKQQVQINPKHPIIVGMNAIRESEPTLAKVLAEQIFDNCLMAAGLLDDGRSMLPRLNDILTTVVKDAQNTMDPVADGSSEGGPIPKEEEEQEEEPKLEEK